MQARKPTATLILTAGFALFGAGAPVLGDGDCDTAEPTPWDLDGGPRFADDALVPDTGLGTFPIVDMGAYERADCNGNGVLDEEDIASGYSEDANENGVPDECEPLLSIIATEPPSGAIDARQPCDVDGTNPDGWQAVDVTFDGPALYRTELDFIVAEEGGDGIAPSITCVAYVDDETVRLHLSEPIQTVAWTTITHITSGTSVTLGYLPADASGDGNVAINDITKLIDYLNGVATPAWGDASTDIDRNGTFGTTDITRLVDLLNGAGVYDVWLNTALP